MGCMEHIDRLDSELDCRYAVLVGKEHFTVGFDHQEKRIGSCERSD